MLDEIRLQNTGVSKTDGIYTICAEWMSTYEEEPFSGPYTLVLMKGYDAVCTWKEGSKLSAEHKVEIPIDLSAQYLVKVGGETSSGAVQYSNSKKVLFHNFDGIIGNFDGENLHLKWNPREDITYVKAVLDDGSVYKSGYGDSFFVLPICLDNLSTAEAAKVRLIPYCEENSFGPSAEITFYPYSAVLDEIIELEETEGSTKIKSKITHPYGEAGITDMQLEMVIICDGGEWDSALAGGVKSGGEAVFSFDAGQRDGGLFTYAKAQLCVGSKGKSGDTDYQVKGRSKTEAESLPLGRIELTSVISDETKGEVKWSYRGIGTPSMYEIVLGSSQYKAVFPEIQIDFGSDYEKEAVIRPLFGRKKGTAIRTGKIFRSGYFVSEEKDGTYTIRVGDNSPKESSASLKFAFELFTRHLTESVKKKGIELSPTEKGYTLTITEDAERTREDYEEFLISLDDIKITAGDPPMEVMVQALPETVGLIKEACGRLAACSFDDLLFYTYGFSEKDRCIDLRPGMTLMVESEGYKPVLETNEVLETGETRGQYLPGYYHASAVWYEVHSYGKAENYLVGFEPYLSRTETPAPTERGALTRRNGAGGIYDLCQNYFHRSYYVLHYPMNYLDSQNQGSDYAPSNVCILGASSYKKISAAVTDINSGKEVQDTTVGQSYFRGRTAIVPKITIYVNGIRTMVSVGTTLRNIIDQEGGMASFGIRFSMERRCTSATVNYLPVHFPDADLRKGWADLPLLAGDKIKFF